MILKEIFTDGNDRTGIIEEGNKMPSIYAHQKFGDMVWEKLPKDERKIIRQYYQSFQIGLQGPDYLFFYKERPTDRPRRKGHKLHRMDTYEFMEKALEIIREKGKESREYCYILGFILHFVLDSECHPYVAVAEKETGCSHAEIECDFDYLMLLKDNQVPHHYKLAQLVPTNISIAECMDPFYDDDMTPVRIQSALKRMKRVKKYYYVRNPLKRRLIESWLKKQKRYNRMYEQAIFLFRNEKCKKQTDHLYELAQQAVSVGVDLITNFGNAVDGGTLSDGFHKDFLGRTIKPELDEL